MRAETAKSLRRAWKGATADWKPALLLSLPIFAAAMWFGVARDYNDIGLFAVAMALGAWSISDAAVLLFRRLRNLRPKSRGGRSA